MSVCTFGPDELGNVAAAILNGKRYSLPTSEDIHLVCYRLSLVSRANVACFNVKYGDGQKVAPVSAREIEMGLIPKSRDRFKCDLKRAVVTAQLLHYNCVDSAGDFTGKVRGARVALSEILVGVLDAVALKAGLLS